jgi:hypothetical protein
MLAMTDTEDWTWNPADNISQRETIGTNEFTVSHFKGQRLVLRPENMRPGPFVDEWRVYLPHQCDEWDIAGEDYGDRATYEEAEAALSRFVAEAQEALEKLRAMRSAG